MVNFGYSKFFDESVKVAGKNFPVENQEYKTRASAIIRSIQLTSSKVIPNALADGIEGIVVCPTRLTPCKLTPSIRAVGKVAMATRDLQKLYANRITVSLSAITDKREFCQKVKT